MHTVVCICHNERKKRGLRGRFRQTMLINYLSQLNNKNQHADVQKQSPYNTDSILTPICEDNMCEFNVILNGKTQFKDAVYAKTENNTVTVKNVLGEAKEFKNCKITEVDVNATRLVLTATKP
jgi:predicted RNA-binding protein